MHAIPYLLIFFAASAVAGDAADRASIGAVVAALNELPRRSALFTEDADGSADLDRLQAVKWTSLRIIKPSEPLVSRPTVTISHEPWGEATINFPGMVSFGTVELLNPRIACRAIRFITPEVALADGDWTYRDEGGKTQTVPLLFVMKKAGETWKIASLRRPPEF